MNVQFVGEHIIVVNKPEGLLTVPGRGEDKQDCLINRLLPDYSDALVVHRLDMATSGLVLFARNKETQRDLSIQFEQRVVKKRYVALVQGMLPDDAGEINVPIMKDWPNRPKQKVDFSNGKTSVTRYRVLSRDWHLNRTRVELSPITGRSHQLRLHLQFIGHPIIGDPLYGCPENQQRLYLHASYLQFADPERATLATFNSEPPF